MSPFALAPRTTELTLSPQLLTPQDASYKALFPTYLWPSQGKSGGLRGTAFPRGESGLLEAGGGLQLGPEKQGLAGPLGKPSLSLSPAGFAETLA